MAGYSLPPCGPAEWPLCRPTSGPVGACIPDASCRFPRCRQAGISQGWFQALCLGGWVQSSLASRGEFGFSFWTSEEGPVGKRKQTRWCQPRSCTLSLGPGLTTGAPAQAAQGPAGSQQLHTSHRHSTQGAREKVRGYLG